MSTLGNLVQRLYNQNPTEYLTAKIAVKLYLKTLTPDTFTAEMNDIVLPQDIRHLLACGVQGPLHDALGAIAVKRQLEL